MNIKIPGLIANQKDDAKLTSAELQAKRDSFAACIKTWEKDVGFETVKQLFPDQLVTRTSTPNGSSNSYVDNNYSTGIDPYWGVPGQNQFVPQKVHPGPFPRPGYQEDFNAQDWAIKLQDMISPKVNPFQVMLDIMFDMSEKEQFLINLGFEFFTQDGEDYMQREVAGILEKGKKLMLFDTIFLREMMIKFKNLLISKNSLKLKI